MTHWRRNSGVLPSQFLSPETALISDFKSSWIVIVAHLFALGPAVYHVQNLQSLLCLQRSLQADQLSTSSVIVASLCINVALTFWFGHTNSEPKDDVFHLNLLKIRSTFYIIPGQVGPQIPQLFSMWWPLVSTFVEHQPTPKFQSTVVHSSYVWPLNQNGSTHSLSGTSPDTVLQP